MTRINPREILKNTTALIIANVVNLLSSFALTLFIARELEVTGFGVYSTVFLFFSLTATFSALGLGNYVTRELARDLLQTNRYFVHGSLIATLSSTLIGLILWIIAPLFNYVPETILGIQLIMLSLLPSSVRVVIEAIFINHQRTEFLTLISIIEAGGKIAFSLLLLFTGQGALALILVFVVFRYVAMFSGLYFMIRFIFRPHWEFEWAFAIRMLRELGTFAMLLILTGTFEQIEVVFLSLMHGETAVGVYTAAFKLITLWDILPTNYMRTIFPLMSQAHVGSAERLNSLQAKSMKYLLSLALPLLVGTMVCADPIIRFFYGDGYDRSIVVLQILGFVIVPMFIQHIPWRILIARDRQGLALKAQIISIIARIILALLLVPTGSYIGTSLTLVLAMIIDNLVHLFYMHKISDHIRFIRLSWRFALAAAGMGVVLLFLNQLFNLFVTVFLGMVIYGILVLLLRGFSEEDFDLLRRIWRPSLEEQDYKRVTANASQL